MPGEAPPFARVTPYELALADAGLEDHVFPAIADEAESRGVDARDRERFLMLGAAGGVIRELVAREDASGPVADQAGALLYHGFHFWRNDRPLYVLERDLARLLVDADTLETAGDVAAARPAGYLQLPRHLFWARIDEAAAPESVDGLFWTEAAGRMELLLALGLMPGRPGLSIVPITVERADGDAGLAAWLDAPARPGGRDFENVLPGGELDDLYAITTPDDAMKLLARVFAWVAAHPQSVAAGVEPTEPEPRPEPRATAHELEPQPEPEPDPRAPTPEPEPPRLPQTRLAWRLIASRA